MRAGALIAAEIDRINRAEAADCANPSTDDLPDDLPSWVSMHATATGADLIEHDPNGDQWERWVVDGWRTDHAKSAKPGRIYRARRRSAPVEPTTEKVGLHELSERRPAVQPHHMVCKIKQESDKSWAYMPQSGGWYALSVDADGMVTVLREEGAS